MAPLDDFYPILQLDVYVWAMLQHFWPLFGSFWPFWPSLSQTNKTFIYERPHVWGVKELIANLFKIFLMHIEHMSCTFRSYMGVELPPPPPQDKEMCGSTSIIPLPLTLSPPPSA